jgi:hypothetical protein
MTVTTSNEEQILSLEQHFARAEDLGAEVREQLGRLAGQMDAQDQGVLPLIGAGASVECGVRLAGDISKQLYAEYRANPNWQHEDISDPRNLGEVAQAIYNASDQETAVRALGLDDPEAWPAASAIPEHFCVFRVIARLVREQCVQNAVGFNYDCQSEAGLDAEGFQRSPYRVSGELWRDNAWVVSDRATHAKVPATNSYVLYKAHGCAARYRERAVKDEASAAESIILRTDQLQDWREDLWIRDTFRSLVRTHVVMLIGFSGNDPVVAGELKRTLKDALTGIELDGRPRVIAIDHSPNTPAIGAMIGYGLNGGAAAPDAVTKVKTSDGSATSAMLVLLAEWLAIRLATAFENAGYELPVVLNPRLAALVITGPLMTRWSYLLRRPAHGGFVQRINLHEAASKGYAPLQADRGMTAQVLRTRCQLRRRLLGISADETSSEALADDGFLVRGGRAFLPVGLDLASLQEACKADGAVRDALAALPHPDLDCIAVPSSAGTEADVGVSMDTGETVVF